MKKFDLIETTGDIGFKAYGKNISEAFENAALALFEIMTDTTKITPKEKRDIKIKSEDLGALLFDWITKLLYLTGAEGLIMSKFKVLVTPTNSGFTLEAQVKGELFDPTKHEGRVEVKAMTYHLMEIHDEPHNCYVQAVVDI